jgi:endonuclease YncB( thermonuclease family)
MAAMRILTAVTRTIPIPAPGEPGYRVAFRLAWLIVAVSLIACPNVAAAVESCAPEAGGVHTVARVIDAETIALEDGSEVRLIGTLPPNRFDGPAAEAVEAQAREALERLVQGRRVELRYGGRHRDRYGRHLAHAFALDGDKNIWVQGQLIEAGYARAYALPGNDACLKEMIEKERQARQDSRGMWSNSHQFVRNSDQVRELLAARGRFILVEGRVHTVAERGGRAYVNFGRDWRRDFTASAPPGLLRRNAEAATFLRSLEGRKVRVRGWLERRNGPFIEIASVADIEVLDEPAAAGQADATVTEQPQN